MSFFEGSKNHIITGGEFTGLRVENGGQLEVTDVRVEDGGRLGFTEVRVDNVEQFANFRVENIVLEGHAEKAADILRPHVAMSAVHNSGQRFDPPTCHPNTRTAAIAQIKKWVMSPRESKMFWLQGAVGAGKSALAQALADLCYRQSELILIGTFFFSRAGLGEERGNGKHVVATLAYQIMQALPKVKPLIEKALTNDPLIFGRSTEAQFEALLFDPLLKVFPPTPVDDEIQPPFRPLFIIIDGLDECYSREVQSYLLETIHKMINRANQLPLKILVSSRPEVHLRDIFNYIKKYRNICELNLSQDLDVHDDIRRFLVEKCCDLKKNHRMHQYIPQDWPTDSMIAQIILKSSSHFIYVATVMKYVQSYRHLPHERMDIILGLAARPMNESPLAALDALYEYILSQVDDFDAVSRVLAILLIPPPDTDYGRSSKIVIEEAQRLTPSFLETLLFLPPGRLELLMTDLVSIVNMENPTQPISFFHASFSDYLCDPSRSGRFYLGNRTRMAHADLARGLARYVSSKNVQHIVCLDPFIPDPVTALQVYTNKVLGYYAPFYFHYACSRPTHDFCPDLLEFNFASSFRTGYHPQYHGQELSLLLVFYSEFLAYLEEYGAEEAVSRNTFSYYRCIDQFLHSHRGRGRGLHDVLALADYDIDSVTVFALKEVLQDRSPLLWEAVKHNGLHLGRFALVWHTSRSRGMFQRCLLEVLWDPTRSGQYALSADKRLMAFIRCLQSICVIHGTTLNGIEEFDLTGITGSSQIADPSQNDLRQTRILTDLALLSRSMALLSKIQRGSPTSRRLHSILTENGDVIQQILNSNKFHISTSTRAAACELSKAISDFLIENDQTVAHYRRPANHLADNELLGTVGSYVRNTIANWKW